MKQGSSLLISVFLFFAVACNHESQNKTAIKDSLSLFYDSTGQFQTDSLSQFSDSININLEYGSIKAGSLTVVVSENAPLWKDSLLTIKSGIQLHVGDTVFIRYKMEKEKPIKNWLMPIYFVRVLQNKKLFDGYIGQRDLCLLRNKLDENHIILVSVREDNTNAEYSKVLMNYTVTDLQNKIQDELVADAVFTPDFEEGYNHFYFQQDLLLNIFENSGIRNIKKIIELNMAYGACGYNSGSHIILWDGKKMHYALATYNMSEAGLFSNYSAVVYPQKIENHSPYDTILLTDNHVEYSESADDYAVTAHDSTITTFLWDPKSLQVKQVESVKSIKVK